MRLALVARLALAGGSRRQPLVSDDAAVSPDIGRGLAGRVSKNGGGAFAVGWKSLKGSCVATIAEAMAIAFNYHQRGDLAEAEKIYRQIVEAEPQHADAWHLLGVAAQQAGRTAEAAESIARAVAINGSNPTYYNHLGAAYAVVGQNWNRPKPPFAARWRSTRNERANALQPGRAA